ncbi:MAG: DNA-methyltransferase [Paraclostridium sp.]
MNLKRTYFSEDGNIKLFNGDCLDVMDLLIGNGIKVDLVVTSPPYDDLRTYKGTCEWDFEVFKKVADRLYKCLNDGGIIVWVIGDKVKDGGKTLTSFRQALYFKEIGFNMYDTIIYEKSGTAPPHKNRYFGAYEFMFVLTKGKPKTINLLKDKPNKYAGTQTFGDVTRREKDGSLTNKGKKTIQEFGTRTNIWKYVNGKGFSTKDDVAYQHPAIFPEKLAEDHIKSWSNEGDLVLDCFLGSGTTGKMAKINNRNFIGIEKVEEYFDIAVERIK